MATKVKLSDVVDALATLGDERSFYFDTNTGKIHMLSSDELDAGEEDDPLEDYPEWEQETIVVARRLAQGDDESLIELPTRWDVNEYEIMEDFCKTQPDPPRDALAIAIQGKGAFRRFKAALHRFDVADEWYRFRDAQFRTIAVEWCEANKIAYIDDVGDK